MPGYYGCREEQMRTSSYDSKIQNKIAKNEFKFPYIEERFTIYNLGKYIIKSKPHMRAQKVPKRYIIWSLESLLPPRQLTTNKYRFSSFTIFPFLFDSLWNLGEL